MSSSVSSASDSISRSRCCSPFAFVTTRCFSWWCCNSDAPFCAAMATTAAARSYSANLIFNDSVSLLSWSTSSSPSSVLPGAATVRCPNAPRSLTGAPNNIRFPRWLEVTNSLINANVSASGRILLWSASVTFGETWITLGQPTTAWPPTVTHTT